MKELDQLKFPQGLRYAKSHEWLQDGDICTVGITDYAQDQLGDIVFVDLPEVGATLARGSEFGTLESVKAVSEIYAPISGEVVEINAALADIPALVNESPFDAGWLLKLKAIDPGEVEDLMDNTAYLAALKGE
jgi:glycine cleavage system H protein